MKQRVWELDVLRGICVLGMVVVHLVYDLVSLYRLVDWKLPELFLFVQKWGGVLFLLISGICVTLGSRSVRRGLIVFACGMICTAVTYGMYHFGFAGHSIIIYFGVLHCLGICMLFGPVIKRLPWPVLAIAGIAIVWAGFHFLENIRGDSMWLMPLGIMPRVFASSDYFPLMPYFGFFLLGSVLGKTLYRQKQSLLPKVDPKFFLLRFFAFCGRQSLWIYLLHQPVLSGVCWLLGSFR